MREKGEEVWIKAHFWRDAEERGFIRVTVEGVLCFEFSEGCKPLLTIKDTDVRRGVEAIFDLDLFRAQLVDGQIIKESDGDPWALTKSEADQICASLQERLTAVGVKVWPVRVRGAGPKP